jgi:hypothetical protein
MNRREKIPKWDNSVLVRMRECRVTERAISMSSWVLNIDVGKSSETYQLFWSVDDL